MPLRSLTLHRGIPDNQRVRQLTVAMCGTYKDPLLKLKAAKQKVLLGWVVDTLELHGGAEFLDQTDEDTVQLGGHLLRCGLCIKEFYGVLALESRVLPDESFPQLQACATGALSNWVHCGYGATTKWHCFAKHLVPQMIEFGNCTYTHNYVDEGENFATRERGNFVHRGSTFGETLLGKWYAAFINDDFN